MNKQLKKVITINYELYKESFNYKAKTIKTVTFYSKSNKLENDIFQTFINPIDNQTNKKIKL